MIIDGSHRRWCIATLLLFLLSSGGYVVYARSEPDGPRGGSVPGMLYGIAGSALMVYAGLISLRKKVPTWHIGSAQTWLRGHIWLGLLSVPLILFHAGFRWGGLLEQILLLVLVAIVASGLIGLAVQQFLPRQMTARVPFETFYAQLPFECRLLQVEGDVAVAAVCGPLPVSPDIDVATQPRLKALGVTERKALETKPKEKDKTPTEKEREKHQKLLASVYRTPGLEEPADLPAVPQTEAPAVAVVASPPAGAPADALETKKPPSTSKNIAMMRAAKHSTPKPADMSSSTEEKAPAMATDMPKQKLSAAEKIALMRAGKNAPPPAPSSSEEAPVASTVAPQAELHSPKQPLSAADKIAMMRAAKGAKPAAATPQPAEKAGDPTDAEAAPAKLSAADKIAMMRAGKAKSGEGARPTTEVVAPQPAASAGKTPQAPLTTEKPAGPLDRQHGADELARFYLESVRPFLGYRLRASSALSNEVDAGGVFAAVRTGLADDLRLALDRLSVLCEKRRQLSVQERMHHWLHGWLFAHVPLSLALLGLSVVHVVLSLYY